MSADPKAMAATLAKEGGKKPLLYAATAETVVEMAGLAKANGASLVVKGATLGELAELTAKAAAAGVEDLVLDLAGGRRLQPVAVRP